MPYRKKAWIPIWKSTETMDTTHYKRYNFCTVLSSVSCILFQQALGQSCKAGLLLFTLWQMEGLKLQSRCLPKVPWQLLTDEWIKTGIYFPALYYSISICLSPTSQDVLSHRCTASRCIGVHCVWGDECTNNRPSACLPLCFALHSSVPHRPQGAHWCQLISNLPSHVSLFLRMQVF